MINDTEGCMELIAAIIDPDSYTQTCGRKRIHEKEELPELDDVWLELAAGFLDIDEEVVKKSRE